MDILSANSLKSKTLNSLDARMFSISEIGEDIAGIKEILFVYECAIKEVKTKLEVLSMEFQVKSSRNPIESIQWRVKKPQSIAEKLVRRGFKVNLKSAVENLNDIAGIRVICSYVDDIYAMANFLLKQDDITLFQKKDYIKNPKPNGYRSLHLVIGVPVFFSDHTELLKVEVQIRTIAMDFWASLEHQLHYKAMGDIPDDVTADLKECADTIWETDMKMQKIGEKVQNIADKCYNKY